MNRSLTGCIPLLCMITLLAACHSEPASNPTLPSTVPTDANSLAKEGEAVSQDVLGWIHEEGESFTYETVITLEYTPGVAAYVTGYPDTWGPLFHFFMYVPEGALLPEDISGETITLEMRVPILDTDFACADAPMPFEFGPHGTNFREPIIVSVSQHPNLEASCTGYTFYYVEEDPGGTLTYGGLQDSQADQQVLIKSAPAQLWVDEFDPEPTLCKTGIVAYIDHFSRWNMSQGGGGGGGGGGSPPIFIPCP